MNNKYMTLMTITLLAFTAEAIADNSELDELTKPKSKVEAGVGGVTEDSWKFGQYNGLNKSGAFGIGNFDIRGGGDYDSNDATRWRITGKNIGLENRSFTGDYKNQGQYKLHFGYDEIPANRNNSYTRNRATRRAKNACHIPTNGSDQKTHKKSKQNRCADQ